MFRVVVKAKGDCNIPSKPARCFRACTSATVSLAQCVVGWGEREAVGRVGSQRCRNRLLHSIFGGRRGAYQESILWRRSMVELWLSLRDARSKVPSPNGPLLEGLTPLLYSPTGLDLEGPRRRPPLPESGHPRRRIFPPESPSFRLRSGPASPTLGPALQSYTVRGLTLLGLKPKVRTGAKGP